ncbi:MAG: hypothetical protein ACJAUV_001083 [Flavobacteriales bacterium]
MLKYLSLILLAFNLNIATSQVIINELLASNLNTNIDQLNEADDWLELHNTTNTIIDIGGWQLSDDFLTPAKWTIPNGTTIPANGFLLIWADNDVLQGNNHANFKLSAGGEQIMLTNPINIIIDSLSYGPQQTDISYGRSPDGGLQLGFFTSPTPGATNGSAAALSVTTDLPLFSIEAGFYEGTQELTFQNRRGFVHFTLDGSIPTEASPIFNSAIEISVSTVIRARVIENRSLPGVIVTKTCFIDEGFEQRGLPVVSLSTDHNYFYQADSGIYVQNFKPDWEYPINIEFFEKDGSIEFNEGAGVKILGERSWVIPQKMLGLSFKSKFGSSKLNYQLFPELAVKKFESISLRASGSDWGKTLFRDAIQQYVTQPNMTTDIQGFRSAIVFFNGKYLGIHNLRTRTNTDFLQERYQMSTTDFEMIENHGEVVAGTNFFYSKWYNYLDNNNFFNQQAYDSVKTMMDVDNFMDYMITWIFSANISWGDGNVAMYRSRDNGKWKWLIMDFDRGFDAPNYPNMEFFTEKNNPGANNPLWASLPIRKLLKNQEFENRFIQRFADNLYTTYHPTTLNIALAKFINNIDQEIERHGQRWGDSTSIHGDGIKSVAYWQTQLDVMRDFIAQRNDNVANNLIANFTSLTNQISLDLNTLGKGQININDHPVPAGNWSGKYFNNRNITLRAIPEPGEKFSHWNNAGVDSLNATLAINITQDTNITAVFIPATSPFLPIVINEIKYENATGFATDWIELYNPNNFPINLLNWKLKGKISGDYFLFEGNQWINADDYVVVSPNQHALQKDYPSLIGHTGNLPFNLSNESESLQLINSNNKIVDEVSYSQKGDWPKIEANMNYSIQLISPTLDNNKGKNWGSTAGNTIGAKNFVSGYQLTDISNQFINRGQSFSTIDLNDFLICTDWTKDTIVWVAQTQQLSVIISENLAQISYPANWTGLDSIKFIATNPNAVSVFDMAYFGVGTIVDDATCEQVFSTDNSPYFLPKGISIADECSLTISEGVTVFTGHQQDIEILGNFSATGSPTKPIVFDAIESEWGGLKLKTANDTVRLSNVVFRHASYSRYDSTLFNAALSVNQSNVVISNSLFEHNRRCIYSKHASVHIDNCVFKTSNNGEKVNLQFTKAITENSTFEYTYGDNDALDYDAVFNGIIQNNTLLGGEDDGIDIGQIDGVACKDVLITGNLSSNYKDKAVSVGEESTNIMIQRNLLLFSNSGASIKDNSSAHLYHNTIYGNKIGVACYEKHEGFGGGIADVVNCIISNSDSLAFFSKNSSQLSVSYSLVYPQQYDAVEMVYNAPSFINLTSFDLSESSPAIDKGTNIIGSDEDGTTPDLGAKYFKQTNITEARVSIFPNPAIGDVTIDLNLKPTQEVLITFTTVTGLELQRMTLQPSDFNILGRTRLNLMHHDMAAGTYLINIFYNNEHTSKHITLLRDE